MRISHVPRLLALVLYVSTTVTCSVLEIADFTSSDAREVETVDDPVMGGSSHSSSELSSDCLVWKGEVEDVWFLRSPGFCILETAGRQDFSGLGDTSGISVIVKEDSDMLLPMSAQIATGAVSKRGRPVTYTGVLAERSRKNGQIELYAPWDTFVGKFRGQKVIAPPLDSEELNKTYRIGLSTYESHKAGEFHVKLVKIVAGIEDATAD